MSLAIIVIIANFMTAARLLCYRRCGARYRRVVSIFAYLLIVATGGQAIDTLVNHADVSIWEAGVSVVLTALVWRARGNVAGIMRLAP